MTKFFTRLSTKYAFFVLLTLLVLIAIGFYVIEKNIYTQAKNLQFRLSAELDQTYFEHTKDRLFLNKDILNRHLFSPLYQLDIFSLNIEISHIRQWLQAESILVMDKNGVVVSDGSDENKLYGETLFLPDELRAKGLSIQQQSSDTLFYFSIEFQGDRIGYGLIKLKQMPVEKLLNAMDTNITETLISFEHTLRMMAFIGLILIGILSVILGWYLYRTLSNPLQQMRLAAEQFAAGNLSYSLPVSTSSDSEISGLALSLNKMARDIKVAEEKVIHQAHFDSLTGLPNRFLILDRLKQLLNDAERNLDKVAVLFLDLDNFKKVNDTLGHDVGDQLLIEAANRLRKVVRKMDTVGRLGGDEFIILLTRVQDTSHVISVLESLLENFSQIFKIDNRELRVTVSIGISFYPENGRAAKEVLRHADSAMYDAKAKGKNTFSFFTQSMNLEAQRHLELEEQILGALERNEFSVVYQPKLCVKSNRVIGAEALLRWTNPVLGVVRPDEFIPVSEQTGLINSIGEFVLTEACRQAALWQKSIPGFHIAVNVSPVQLRTQKLCAFMRACIDEYQLKPNSIEIEVTEGVLISLEKEFADPIKNLAELGVSIAMDDFGTGYSSLNYLRLYPFNVLKVDRSFVRDITEDSRDRELIKASIVMAHSLGLKVVAEGVETQEQLDFLKENNCDGSQGYYFSKPLNEEGMSTFILAQQSSTITV